VNFLDEHLLVFKELEKILSMQHTDDIDVAALQDADFTPFVMININHYIRLMFRGVSELPDHYERDYYITPQMNVRNLLVHVVEEYSLASMDSTNPMGIDYVLSLTSSDMEGTERKY
jgi:hypothetical protein